MAVRLCIVSYDCAVNTDAHLHGYINKTVLGQRLMYIRRYDRHYYIRFHFIDVLSCATVAVAAESKSDEK